MREDLQQALRTALRVHEDRDARRRALREALERGDNAAALAEARALVGLDPSKPSGTGSMERP